MYSFTCSAHFVFRVMVLVFLVNQRLAALKSYLKYVSDGDISLMQVYMRVQKVPLLRAPKLQRPVIEKKELGALLDEPPDTPIGNRDRVILILLFDSAVRVSELTGIVLGDLSLDVSHPSITVYGNIIRHIFLSASFPETVKFALSLRKKMRIKISV